MMADDDRLTLARVHAVLGAISVALIGQLTSANPVTPELNAAVRWFAVAILLNLFCYLQEVSKVPMGCEHAVSASLLALAHFAAVCVTLFGISQLIEHFEPAAGKWFTFVGAGMVGAQFARVGLSEWAYYYLKRRAAVEARSVSARVNQLNQEIDAGRKPTTEELGKLKSRLENLEVRLAKCRMILLDALVPKVLLVRRLLNRRQEPDHTPLPPCNRVGGETKPGA